jgi:peptidoglycan/LPS O-acetylase OafA/YrhL
MRLVRVGLALFALGLILIAVDVVPFFFGHHNTGLWLNLGCLAAPLGFALAVYGGLKPGRDAQREAVRELSR